MKKFLIFINTLLIFFIICLLGGYTYIFFSAPDFNRDLLYKKESSNIYDAKGNLITTIGTEKRQIVTYEELPQVLIDAIIATEDSRFYEHKGMDVPRFIKASIAFITGSNEGGASTLTMQISKNTYTSNKSKGIDGIIRKFTDIYLAIFKIEKDYTKKDIIEFYVNTPYLGSGNYGVQMASKTYFDKNVSDLNLAEAAIIAGLFQSPGDYDPNINPDKTNYRKNQVIKLMLRHGYITKDEAEIAEQVDVTKLLKKQNEVINKYQGFIDTVVQEVINKTGDNPYEVSMDIYSTMIKEKQDVINDFYKKHKFKDNKVQVGIGVIDNKTGSIIAVGAGRYKNSELSYNYATQIKRHPGSTAKPLFDYGPGIEYNNWSTYTQFNDAPTKYTYGGYIHNVDNRYQGTLTLEQCLVRSRNTCALQAFKKVNNSKINKFVTTLGIVPEYLNNSSTYINEAHSIGGFTGVSPVQLASAYSAFGNEGKYTEAHSVNKIVYKNEHTEKELEFVYETKQAMKPTTAYMIAYMLKKATSTGVKLSGTDIAAKTGTSSYDEKTLKKLGLNTNVIQDAWTVSFSPDYSVAIWYGYDKLTKKTYNTTSHAWAERKIIQKEIVNKIMEKNSKFKKPSGIVSKTINSHTYLFLKGHEPKFVEVKKEKPKTASQNPELPQSILP